MRLGPKLNVNPPPRV
uniref:Uncharacterized protein n=1 Tax=Arundo donax TaxID=35708 RepID=A0A0A9SQY1_ARUDO